MSERNAMASLTRWVLAHKRLVVGLWLVVAVGGVAAMRPAGEALSRAVQPPGHGGVRRQQPRRRRLRQRRRRRTARAGRDAPAGQDGRLPWRRRRELGAALAKVEAALPGARVASYASTHDRAFVSDDGRTTFALVSIPAKGGMEPGQAEARAAQAALAGVTVGGSPVAVTGLDALRAAAADGGGGGRHERARRGAARGRAAPCSSSRSSSRRSWRSCRC